MNYKLKKSEGIYLMVNLLCAKLFLLTPYLIKRAAVTNVIFFLAAAFLPYFLIFFFKRNVQPGKIILFIAGICLTIYLSFTVYEYAGVIRTMFFNNTPVYFTVLFMAVAMIYAAGKGLKAIGKLCGFFVPFVYFVCALLVVFAFKSFTPSNLFPFFGSTENLLKYGYILLSVPGECIIYLLLPDVLEKKDDFKKIFLSSFFISFLLFILVCSAFVMAGFEQTETMPMFMLIRLIKIRSFFQRADLIFLLLSAISVFLSLSSLLYFAAKCFCNSLKTKKEGLVIVLVGIISSLPFPAQIFRNYIPFILIFTLILPLFIRRKDSKNLKKALSLLILLLPLLLSSCFDSKEVDDMTYVVAVGADKEGYTFQLALPLNISGDKEADAEQEDEAFSLYSVKINEPDFKIATDKLNSKISKSADLSHISLFVFSEELVLEGLGDFYEVLSDIKIRPSAYLTVAQNPDEFLKSVSSPFELNPAKYYEMLYSNEERSSYESLTVYDFLSRDTLVMPISSSDGKEEGSYVLKSKKAMLKLSPEEMFYFRILKGSLPLSHIKNTAGTFELKSASHTDISLKENDAKIKIHLNGNKKTAYKITKGCKNLLLKAQKNNIDLLGIKDKTRKNFLTLETYQNSGFDIKNINFRTELVYEE